MIWIIQIFIRSGKYIKNAYNHILNIFICFQKAALPMIESTCFGREKLLLRVLANRDSNIGSMRFSCTYWIMNFQTGSNFFQPPM